MIGKLEELTLMASLRAGKEALPSAIYQRVLQGQQKAAFGAVYTTISRLATKRLLEEGVRQDESGRERRVFTITGEGRQALTEAIGATAVIGGFEVSGGWNVVGG